MISLDRVVKGLGSDNLIKVIMEAFMIGGGVPRDQIVQKLICFVANDVNVFQNTKSGVVKKIKENYAPHFIRVCYMPTAPIWQCKPY